LSNKKSSKKLFLSIQGRKKTLEQLAKLKPTLWGICADGNSSSESDNAAVCLITSEEMLQ
jgi:hypothetical protein